MIIAIPILIVNILLLSFLIYGSIKIKENLDILFFYLEDISTCLEQMNKREWLKHINSLIDYKKSLIQAEQFEQIPPLDEAIKNEIREFEKRYKNGSE